MPWPAGRTSLLNTGRLAEGAEDGRRSLAMARDLGYPAGEGKALQMLGIAASYSGDYDGAVQLIRQQQLIAGVPALTARVGNASMIDALIETGDLAAAESACAEALARCRDAGDVFALPQLLMADGGPGHAGWPFPGRRRAPARNAPDRCAGRRLGGMPATACGPARGCAPRPGATPKPPRCGPPRPSTARQQGIVGQTPGEARRREEALSKAPAGAWTRPGPGGRRARRGDEPGHRGRVRPDAHRPRPAAGRGHGPGPGRLSARERELVTLVAQGRTDAADRRCSCTSPSAPSARTWTGSGTRPAAAAAPT